MRSLNEFEVEKTFVERAAPVLQINDERDEHREEEAGRIIVGKTRIGPGLVKDTVGVGGMASIYLVWNDRLELFRAIKMMSRDTLYERFETEVKISAKLRHPNIVEIYNVGEWNGMPYMEMEYIDGEDLQRILNKRGKFPEAVCCAAAICMANALHYAHNLEFTLNGTPYKGIIHRDLKPANIMFSKKGEVKLTDFGIARPAQASLHTMEGNIVGTLHYLSPEQMEGRNVDCRSDIYSLGTLIYEMATGAKTFPQESITELMRQRTTNSFKKPADFAPSIGDGLSRIIMRCLKVNPKDRYPDTQSLLDDLRKEFLTFTDAEPNEVLSSFYPQNDSIAPYITKTDIKKTKTTEILPKISIPKISMPKKNVLIILLIMFLILPMSYMSVKFISMMSKTQKQLTADEPTKDTQDEKSDDDSNPPAQPADTIQIATVPTTTIIPDPKITPNTTPKSPTPAAAPPTTPLAEPPKPAAVITEDDQIRAATAALNRKDWDQAIRALERTGVAYKDKKDHRDLLLLEAFVESKRWDRAAQLIESATRTNDAHYLLSAGKYRFYRKNYAGSIETLEAALTRPSISRNKNIISDDAIYYIAMARNERFKSVPSNANRMSAVEGWQRVQSAYGSRRTNPRFERAEKEIAALN